jgi:hypothetical protein
MSPAGLVINYTFRDADAYRNLSHLMSKANLFGPPHARAHGIRARKSKSWRSWLNPCSGCCVETAIARARGPIGFPRHAAQGFPDPPEAAIASCSPFALSLQPETLWELQILTPLHCKRMNEPVGFPSRLSIWGDFGEAASECGGGA